MLVLFEEIKQRKQREEEEKRFARGRSCSAAVGHRSSLLALSVAGLLTPKEKTNLSFFSSF